MSSSLEELINNIKNCKEKKNQIFHSIKDYNLLISSLYELKNIIGNEDVKNSIVDQINYFLFMKSKVTNENVMLNTVLYGPPGVGKTIIGTVLSKIWHAIGYFKEDKNTKIENKLVGAKTIKNIYQGKSNLEEILQFILTGILIITTLTSILSAFFSNKLFRILIIFFLIYIIFVIYTIFYTSHNNKDEIKENIKDVKTNNYLEKKEYIKIVSRDDFVDKYVGWTGKKTQALLESCIGKVLFVDEAYSIVNDPRDSFGIEALTVINLFLSQNPGKIIVIFAGYKDLMEKNIFSIQPGLKRRFMWHFDCKPYNEKELFEIFLYQISREDWNIKVSDKENIYRLFIEKKDLFTENGGDTEKLFYFSRLEYSREFMKGIELENKTLTFEQIKKAIEQLKRNKNSDNKTLNNKEDVYSMLPYFNMLKDKYY